MASSGEQLEEQILEAINWRVGSGFYTPDEIMTAMTDSVTDNDKISHYKEFKRKIRQATDTRWEAQLAEESTWPLQPTISHKLETAFRSLERNHKILARMNHTCCQTCGVGELEDDADDDVRGYVFFHQQDTESVVSGSGLKLAFGSFTKSDKKNQTIGEVIVRSLRRAGLSVEWDGNPKNRIGVACAQWRRRLPVDEELDDAFDDDFDSDCASSSGSSEDSQSDLEEDVCEDSSVSGSGGNVSE